MKFVNRQQELGLLADAWSGRGAGLIVVYGRRRVGKTELLREFARERRQVFYVATQSSAAEQLRSFSAAVRRGLGTEASGVEFGDWDGALEFLSARAAEERLLVVVDEFPYLAESRPDLMSILQRAWDERLRKSRILLVLCGSSVAFMESEVLAHRSPLFGRRTGQLEVAPMRFRDAKHFFAAASPVELVELYAVLGGMPAYLLQFEEKASLWDNIRKRILTRGAFLHDEVSFLLMQELREPRLYRAILTAMAEGRTRPTEIADRALGPGQVQKLGFYLQTLQNLHLVERRTPISEPLPHKSRKGVYVITDPFVRFWMRYVLPDTSALEAGVVHPVVERIRDTWADFVAPIFEDICRQFVLQSPGHLPFRPSVVGGWWSSRGEIDVVAFDGARKRMLAGECKWSTRPVGTNVLDDLAARAALLAEEVGVDDTHLYLFARSGFTEGLRKRAADEGVALITPTELCQG